MFVAPNRNLFPSILLLSLVLSLFLCQGAAAQKKVDKSRGPLPEMHRAPASNITVDGSEAMFTTMCALHAAGFERDLGSSGWHPLRARLREMLQQQQGPAVEAIRDFYHQHELSDPGATLSRYIWFGLVSGPAPDFKPALPRDALPPDVIALESFSDLLAAYYREQKIGQLWRQVQPVYQKEVERLQEPVSQLVMISTGYLREIVSPTNPRTFAIVVEPMVGRITNVRNFGDHYAIVLSGTSDIPVDVVRHAFLHFLLDPLPLRYPHVAAVKRPLWNVAARAPRLSADLKDDFPAFFAECLVRAVELKLKRVAPSEREALLDLDDAGGLILVRPLYAGLVAFERSEPSMTLYFPEFVRAVDVSAELKRAEALKFAPADEKSAGADSQQKEVTRPAQRATNFPAGLPNDQAAIAALTEGERMIAERRPREAEAAFKKVLAEYPEQPRARYGLGLVAMLEKDAARAQEVFGGLVQGDAAVQGDPLVLAWSHVYLGRIYQNSDQLELARKEYEAALRVTNGPEPARQAAQKGLAATGGGPPARP